MSDEYLSSANVNGATSEENTETNATNKDTVAEVTDVQENGYESECSSSSRSEEEITYSALETEADAFTRFIERQRLEVMYELRRLRLGERPVTGQSNRERIAAFINDAQETQTPSTRPAAMPSAHIADIDALANRRCVSTALSSTAFRQDLENSIRRTIAPQTVQQPALVRTVTQNPPVAPTVVIDQPPTQRLNLERQEREFDAWQAITELQRERIVVEISDLVHRQLVTSALEGDFRRHLEQNVLSRLERGAPLQAQATVIAVQPNPPPPQPVRTDNTNVSDSTIDALTTRLDSMQQMLQMMFSMQMDMQRSLRQEIAGALASHPPPTTTLQQQPPPPPPVQAGHCTVCLTAIADTVLYRCGHLCVCYICGLQLQQAQTVHGIKCPICRAPVDDILRVYRSSRDGE